MFLDGLDAVMEKVEEYYDKMAASHAYTFVMCVCFSLFNTLQYSWTNFLHSTWSWDEDDSFCEALEQDKVLESMETIVCSFYYTHAGPFYSFSIV